MDTYAWRSQYLGRLMALLCAEQPELYRNLVSAMQMRQDQVETWLPHLAKYRIGGFESLSDDLTTKEPYRMKLSINKLMTLQVSLIALSQTKLPVKASYRIGRALDKTASAGKQAMLDMQALYRQYGTLNAGGTQYTPPTDPEAMVAFQAAWDVVQNSEIEVEFLTVSLADLGEAAIEPAHLMALEGIVLVTEDAPVSNLRLVSDASANE